MKEESKPGIQVKIERFHFSVRLSSIFFPIELAELLPILEEAGYTIRKELVERMPDVPLGAKVVIGGPMAEKRDAGQTFRVETERSVIAIAGQDINGIIEDFSNIERLIKDKLNLVLEEKALFYEFIAEGSANTGSDPTKVIAKLLDDSRLQSEISKILGFSVTNFGVRFVEQNRYVTGAQWSDFRIEPLVPKPDTSYHINVIYRHQERANVVKAAQSLRETIEKLLFAIEREV